MVAIHSIKQNKWKISILKMYNGGSVYGVQRKSIARAAEKPLNMHFQPKVVSTPLILIKTLIWYISTEPRYNWNRIQK